MIRICRRDRALLECLAKYQILSTSQIRTLLFQKSDFPTVLRRLRQLRSANLIKSIGGLRYGSHAWFLSMKGSRLIEGEKPWQFRNRNTLEHDLTVVELRLALERAGYGDKWMTEQELKRKQFNYLDYESRSKNVPDGIFTVTSRKGAKVNIALELELHVKSKTRYQKILRDYASREKIDLIWYVVRSEAEGERILSAFENVPSYLRTAPLRASLLEHVLSNPATAQLVADDDGIAFSEVFPPLKPTVSKCQGQSISEEESLAA